ncbi:MAG: hypothetical protein AB7R69_06095 [Candidatus Babeliales bacterium]
MNKKILLVIVFIYINSLTARWQDYFFCFCCCFKNSSSSVKPVVDRNALTVAVTPRETLKKNDRESWGGLFLSDSQQILEKTDTLNKINEKWFNTFLTDSVYITYDKKINLKQLIEQLTQKADAQDVTDQVNALQKNFDRHSVATPKNLRRKIEEPPASEKHLENLSATSECWDEEEETQKNTLIVLSHLHQIQISFSESKPLEDIKKLFEGISGIIDIKNVHIYTREKRAMTDLATSIQNLFSQDKE